MWGGDRGTGPQRGEGGRWRVQEGDTFSSASWGRKMSAPASLLSAGSQWPLTEAAQGLAGSGAHTVPGREPEVGETVSYGSVKQSGHTDEDRQDVGQGREKAGAPQLQPLDLGGVREVEGARDRGKGLMCWKVLCVTYLESRADELSPQSAAV